MKKSVLWIGVAALLLAGAGFAYSRAQLVSRAHAEGRCICPLTGREIAPDHCPLGGIFEHCCHEKQAPKPEPPPAQQ
jgi:hypothetical protein